MEFRGLIRKIRIDAYESPVASHPMRARMSSMSRAPGSLVVFLLSAIVAVQPGAAADRAPVSRANQTDGIVIRNAANQVVMERIETRAQWKDLRVAESTQSLLRKIAAGRHAKGGTAALFSGVDQAAKLRAAEVIAAEMKLALYRVDLSAVVSKFIGETEKNLDRVFAAAEQSEAVLFFDEGDALFGKRTEVSDSHDRYANQEVSYLLQRIEQFHGLAILATNLRPQIDPALLRRFRHVVEFVPTDGGKSDSD
jgi:hypothetical protein